MTADVECRYYGRDFTTGEMALLRALIAASPPPNRHALSREFCRRIGWLKPDGGLKDMMARVDHAGHAQRRADRSAAAEMATPPASAHGLRTGHRTAAVPGADHPR